MFRNSLRRTYTTIKSNNDEQANKALLSRLKHIPVKKEVVIKENLVNYDSPLRFLTYEKLNKLIKLYTSDPLIWNSSTLCRIFNLPHDICEKLVLHVRPFVFYTHRDMDEARKMVKCPIVIDLARMKVDKNYLADYKKLAFLEEPATYVRRALE